MESSVHQCVLLDIFESETIFGGICKLYHVEDIYKYVGNVPCTS